MYYHSIIPSSPLPSPLPLSSTITYSVLVKHKTLSAWEGNSSWEDIVAAYGAGVGGAGNLLKVCSKVQV